MPWQPFQPNPEKIVTGDCTVRALCAVFGLDWKTAHTVLCALARELSDMPSENRVWWRFLSACGFRRYELLNICPDCYTVRDFARDHPVGKYVLGPMQHAVAVINGDWWDAWDSGSTVPLYYFEEEQNNVSSSDVAEPVFDAGTADAHGGSCPG